MSPSLESDHSYLAFLPSNYRLLAHYPSILAARWLCADLDNRWNIFAYPTADSKIPILCCLFLLFLWWPCCIHLYKLSFVSISCVQEWLIIRRSSHSSAVPVAGVGVAAGLLFYHWIQRPSLPLEKNSVKQSLVGLGQYIPVICVSLELLRWQHTFSKYFTTSSGFCTWSRVKFQNASCSQSSALGHTAPCTLPLLMIQPQGRSYKHKIWRGWNRP